MNRKTRAYGAVAVGAVLVLSVSACRPAAAPREPSRPVDFTVSQIAAQPGAAFTVTGNVVGNQDLEIVSTSFNFTFGPTGPSPAAGSVTMYQKSGATWNPTTVVPASEGIKGPNKPNITDVDGDGKKDVIIPAGWFFNVATGTTTGSLTWWKNNGDGTFSRNDLVTNAAGSYHSTVHVDFDKDGKKDIITTLEDGGFPAWPFAGPPIAPTLKTQFFKGLGGGSFAAPVDLAPVGGSLPTVFDIDADGDLDIATAQYFKVKSALFPPNPAVTTDSFIWLENTSNPGDTLDSSKFTKHVIASGLGESFQILAVDNMDGDGKYGAIGVNHVNPALGPSAAPQVFRFTPGSDIRAPWTVSVIADGFTLDDSRQGQAAPGYPSEGDLDGDGDIDITIGGDADWSIYWLERKADGSFLKHDIANEYGTPGTNWGQSGVVVADINRDGKNEIVFSSYNSGTVHVVERVAGTGGYIPAVPHSPDLLMPY